MSEEETSKNLLASPKASSGILGESSHSHARENSFEDDHEAVPDSDLDELEGRKDSINSAAMLSSLSMSSEKLEAKMKQDSMEFAFLQPVCAKILQNPSEENLSIFEERLDTIGTLPVHLSEFVTFPFAIHLKVIRNYKEPQRKQIYTTLAKLLRRAELRGSYDMFVNMFQKLHLALSLPNNMMTVDKQLAEDEMEVILECIRNIAVVSLSHHIDILCKPDKVQIFGHSIYILLQLVAPNFSKPVRLKSIETLCQMVHLCDGKETRSKVLFKFLPGLISSLRKICIPSAAHTIKVVAKKSLFLMGMTIRVCLEFQNPSEVVEADNMLKQIMDLLGKEFVLFSDSDYRLMFFEFCREITWRDKQLPNCVKTISTILLRMKEDKDTVISECCVDLLTKLGIVQEISFDELTNLIRSANTHLKSGDDVACILDLREASSVLSTKKLSFIEFQSFLPLTFEFMDEIVWKYRKSITVISSKITDPVFESSTKFCKSLAEAGNADETVYEFSKIMSDLQYNFNSVKNALGVIVTFNIVLTELFQSEANAISKYEALNVAQVYLALIDMQSTEAVLSYVASDIPATQTVAEIRRVYLLEGLGILGKAHPDIVVPVVLYPLIEHAGSNNSEAVNEASEQALHVISMPLAVREFLKGNLDFIINQISVRMLNLSLYPNCPNAMIFLAQFFDFSQDKFSNFIDAIFENCSDRFGGGNVQHVYVKVFYAIIKSISNHFTEVGNVGTPMEEGKVEKQSLLQKLLAYQKAVGVTHPSVKEKDDIGNGSVDDSNIDNDVETENKETDDHAGNNEEEDKLDPVHNLVLRTSHRVLNFLPNSERSVRLTAMDCLILGLPILKHHENAILPLSHTIWQNLVPRFDEKDFVIIRKSFELLKTLCACCGGFLKKRTIEEAFPKLSTLLLTLAKDAEQVKNKNRQYYTYTQAYKLQLTVLKGMGVLLDAIDVQEFELDKIVDGCIMYLNPDQHKNLREAATHLLEVISSGKHSRTIWMKLIACGIKTAPEPPKNAEFAPLPKQFESFK